MTELNPSAQAETRSAWKWFLALGFLLIVLDTRIDSDLRYPPYSSPKALRELVAS